MMNTPKKWVRILSASLFSAIVAWFIGAYVGCRAGLHAYDDLFFDEALTDIYYTDNPVDCPPCNVKETYEWFYKEPPLDIDLAEKEEFPAIKEEGGAIMGP